MNDGSSVEEIFPSDLLGVSLSFFWPMRSSWGCLDIPFRDRACPGLLSSLYVNKRWNREAHKLIYEKRTHPSLRFYRRNDSNKKPFDVQLIRESFSIFWKRTKWKSFSVPHSWGESVLVPLLDGAIEGSRDDPSFHFESLYFGGIDDMKGMWERIRPSLPLFSRLKKIDLGGMLAIDSICGLREYLRGFEVMGKLDECQLQVVDIQSPPFDEQTSVIYEDIVRMLPQTVEMLNVPQHTPSYFIEKILRKFPLLKKLECSVRSTFWYDLSYFDDKCLSVLAEMKHWETLSIAVHEGVLMDYLWEMLRKVARNSSNLGLVELAFEVDSFEEWLGQHETTGKACRYVRRMVEDGTDDYSCVEISVERDAYGYEDDTCSVHVQFVIRRPDDSVYEEEFEYSESHASDCHGCVVGDEHYSDDEEDFDEFNQFLAGLGPHFAHAFHLGAV